MTIDTNPFRKQHTLEKRQNESLRIRAKYDDKVPIIVTRSSNSNNISKIDKNKFLVPSDLTLGQFIYVIRKRISLSAEESLYLFIDNSILGTTSSSLGSIYGEHKNVDGFLYISYCSENTFGNKI